MAERVRAMANRRSGAPANLIALTRVTHSRGYLFGLEQKCCIASLAVTPGAELEDVMERFRAVVAPRLLVRPNGAAAGARPESADPTAALLDLLSRSIAGLQEAAAIPVRGSARIARLDATQGQATEPTGRWSLALPSLLPAAAAKTLEWAIDLVNALAAKPGADGPPPAHMASLDALLDALRRSAPRGNNVPHLIHAAHDLGIPYLALPMDVFQFGWGRGARLSRGVTETDATPKIGALVARNKLIAASWLRAAEIPVPEHEPAPTLDAALAIASRFGFPVVVKPADHDRGAGVTADLNDDDDVREAYAKASAISHQIMVERHVEGKEFRLVVVSNRLFWAYERVPATVVGDGRTTIRDLIAEANRDRRDGPTTGLALVTIATDDALIEFLGRHGHRLDSIPATGQPIRLQRIPNNVGGGHMRPVFDIIHPDNAAIAQRAARLLRLDIAGIDFITPDISRSWREVGGWITEVNEQPQMSPASRSDIHAALLRELVEGDGRIPVALVLAEEEVALEAEIRSTLGQAGIRAGVASARTIHIGAEEIASGTISIFRAAQALAIDPTVEAIVLITTGAEMMGAGLPFDRIDLLAIAAERDAVSDLPQLLRMARPHLAGQVLAVHGEVALDAIRSELGRSGLRLAQSSGTFPTALCRLLLDRVAAKA